jgi:hypothetical protein
MHKLLVLIVVVFLALAASAVNAQEATVEPTNPWPEIILADNADVLADTNCKVGVHLPQLESESLHTVSLVVKVNPVTGYPDGVAFETLGQELAADNAGSIFSWFNFSIRLEADYPSSRYSCVDIPLEITVVLDGEPLTEFSVTDIRGWRNAGFIQTVQTTNGSNDAVLSIGEDPEFGAQVYLGDSFAFRLVGHTTGDEPIYFNEAFANATELLAWSLPINMRVNGLIDGTVIVLRDQDGDGQAEVAGQIALTAALFMTRVK